MEILGTMVMVNTQGFFRCHKRVQHDEGASMPMTLMAANPSNPWTDMHDRQRRTALYCATEQCGCDAAEAVNARVQHTHAKLRGSLPGGTPCPVLCSPAPLVRAGALGTAQTLRSAFL